MTAGTAEPRGAARVLRRAGPGRRRLARGLALRLLVMAALWGLAACDLPRTAPPQATVLRDSKGEARDVMVVTLGRDTVEQVAQWALPEAAQPRPWPPVGSGERGIILRPGDRLSLTVWDNETNSLLTSEGQKAVAIGVAAVSAAGTVFLPYIGEVAVGGLGVGAARARLQEQVAESFGAAQVQLEVEPGPGNMVGILGGVARAGSYPLPEGGLTALGLLGLAGGPTPALENPQLRLLRGGHSHGIALARLIDDPGADVRLRGGDRLMLEEDGRLFIALGASGKQDLIAFGRESLSALEAVSKIGGIASARGSPRGVLILREYPDSARDPAGRRGPDRVRVVFTLDLSDTEGLFAAARFAIAPGDLVMVTESPGNALRMSLALFSQGLGITQRLD